MHFPFHFQHVRKWQEALGLLWRMVEQALPIDGIHVGAVVSAVKRVLGESKAVSQLRAICKGWLFEEQGALKELKNGLGVTDP